jgi:hypothetical protein
LIFIAWPDGHVVFSGDRLNGGATYRAGKIEPKKIATLLAEFDNDGLLANKKLNDAYYCPDSSVTYVFVKSGKQQVKMQSCHELFESGGKHVAAESGVRSLKGRSRLEVLREAKADYLFFRLVWSEIRTKLADLIPAESTKTEGKPVLSEGELFWPEAK